MGPCNSSKFNIKGGLKPSTGYTPVSDVAPHSRIDGDLKVLNDAVNKYDWTAASAAYNTGGSSKKSTGSIRTLKGFSTGAPGLMLKERMY